MVGSKLQEQVQAVSANSSRDGLDPAARPVLPAAPPTGEGDAAVACGRRAPPIRDLLHAQGIVMRDYSPGQKPHMTCPQCAGGSSGEASLAVVVSDDSRGAAWLCHRGSCGWKGAVNASSGDQLADLLEGCGQTPRCLSSCLWQQMLVKVATVFLLPTTMSLMKALTGWNAAALSKQGKLARRAT